MGASPSLAGSFCAGSALQIGKPLLCLFSTEHRLSAMSACRT